MKLKTRLSKLETRNSKRNRPGSVIVLVVAVLALLAVIGTVYIVSARSERTSAASSSTAANLNLAVDAVNTQAVHIIGDPMYDGNGSLGGTAGAGGFGNLPARTFDMPEYYLNSAGVSAYGGRNESWLASNLCRPFSVVSFTGFYADMTFPQALIPVGANVSPAVFNPADGQYDIPVLDYSTGSPILNKALYLDGTPNSTAGMFRVVADPLPNAMQVPPNGALDDAFVQLLPFSEANGTRYRFGLRILDTSRMANLNVMSLFDPSTTLSLAENSGTYFNMYSGFPFLVSGDTAANLQQSGSLASNPGRQGSWSLPATMPPEWAWGQANLRFENPLIFGSDPRFATGALPAPFDLSDEMELRAYGSLGTMAVPRPAMNYGNMVWPKTLGNRSPPNSSNIAINFTRGNFTTYSASRDLRPYSPAVDNPATSSAYQVLPISGNWVLPPPANPPGFPNGATSAFVWPAFPARVAANPDISTYAFGYALPALGDQAAADTLTIAATNIATAMTKLSGYGPTEACAFVANYLTARWNSWAPDPNVTTSTGAPAYYLPNGPSYVDNVGPCLRGGLNAAGNASVSANYTSTLNSGAASTVYLGFAAQPFFNKIAVQYKYSAPVPPAVTGSWNEQDSAIELYNPYSVPLSLEGFGLIVNGTPVSLSGKGLYVPAMGYFVLTENQGHLDAALASGNNVTHTDAGTLGITMSLSGANKIYLTRQYIDRAGGTPLAAVDQYDATNISSPPQPATAPPDGTIEVDYEARLNNDTSNGDPTKAIPQHWIATVHDPAIAEVKQTATSLTLGAPTGTNNANNPCAPLYDRTLDLDAPVPIGLGYSAQFNRQMLLNVADFAKLMRFCNQIDPTTSPIGGLPATTGTLPGTLTSQVATLYKNSSSDNNVKNTAYPADASLRFDFLTALAPTPTTYKPGDSRANTLLNFLSFTDRVSDYTIDLGDGIGGLSKLRIPGQINVNTASPQVLATIPVLYKNPQLIGYILAYRWRSNSSTDPRIPVAYQPSPAADFTNPTEFPGYGIRSLGELAVPLAVAQNAGVAFTTLAQRDQFWGDVYNCLTVRSDTFVVYAYLEAVRQNPRFLGTFKHIDGTTLPFNNGTDWYLTNSPGAGFNFVSDDPTDTTMPLFRVGRKRWLMLVDRSQANFSRIVDSSTPPVLNPNFAQPKIVAIKDLPQ